MGIKSGHMYACGLASIGLSFCSWMISRNNETAGLDRADRWGIFIGEWAPTFFAMGVALRIEETHKELGEPGSEMFDTAQGHRARSHVGV
ncbi:hypothetical protein ACFFV7_16385 [Nonomuraea spiralis]|uniref:Uncharacterized protein n=2 Tax=Streptosporangiaceae TaxID=2004 RepID=A0ABV5IEK9_9ACTN|nr:hypothetical protein [Nonomuraea spiralis]RSN04401.1 hypothetical protein DMB42_32060 [Nonomuraea sp. WAC 01424]